MWFSRVLLVALGALTIVPRADAQVLFGSTAAGLPGELFTINPATGAMLTDIGPLNDSSATNYPVTGLAFHPTTGLLYGSTGNNPAATGARLITINPVTAQVTVIGSFNLAGAAAGSTMADLAFNPTTGVLYGVGSVGGPQLYTINLATGQATVVGGGTGLTSTLGGGLAVSLTGTYNGTPTASRFGTYDPITGAYTDIANPTKPVGGGYGALEYMGGTLLGLNVGSSVGGVVPTHLVTINPLTGAVTDLGASINSLDAIAFQAVPEPSAMLLLFGPAAFGLIKSVRNRKATARAKTK